MTPEEKRAYQRGYNRTVKRSNDRARRYLALAQDWKAKAVKGTAGAKCGNCRLWTRGGEHCIWGYCSQNAAVGMDRIWAERFVGEHEARRLISQEDFFCNNWGPK